MRIIVNYKIGYCQPSGVHPNRVARGADPPTANTEQPVDVRATLKPGQKGTRRLATQYGDRLVCIGYRYDKGKRKRYDTIELIVDEEAWIDGLRMPPRKAPDPTPVGAVLVRIHYREAEPA
jgi:hypothetical protein